jgi:hypothetical protein
MNRDRSDDVPGSSRGPTVPAPDAPGHSSRSPTLDSGRLRLRPFTRDEAEHIRAGDRTGRRWSPGYRRDDDRDVARMYLDAVADGPPHDPWFGPLRLGPGPADRRRHRS